MEVSKKYKPGPWNLKESFLEDDDNRYRILTITSDEGNVVASNEQYSLTEPQARLISAAPELLMALKYALEVLGNTGLEGQPELAEAYETMEDAIKKAEGKK